MAYNNAISASDPQAVEKLTAKLEQCQQLQTMMKDVNAYWRRHGTCVGAPGITEEQAQEIDDRIASPRHAWDTVPYGSYALTNNNSEIRRLETRIEELTHAQEVGFSGWEFEGGRAEANTELNRLQLFFDSKPTEDQRAQLKANGFKWAPSQNAWQRQLNENAIYAAGRLSFLRPTDGRYVSDHQPKKASARDTGGR